MVESPLVLTVYCPIRAEFADDRWKIHFHERAGLLFAGEGGDSSGGRGPAQSSAGADL